MNEYTHYFNQMFHEHYQSIYRYMYRLTCNREDAADLVQEAFLKLYESRIQLDKPRSWLNRTGYNLFIDKWRKPERRRCLPMASLPDCACGNTPERKVIISETRDRLNLTISKLKPRAQRVILLRERDGKTYSEISRKIGCSENTIKSIIHRSRSQMGKWLQVEREELMTGSF